MAFKGLSRSSKEDNDPFFSINSERPLRIAILGGKKAGKLSIAARLSSNVASDTYYPTHKTNVLLFQFLPQFLSSRAFLDPTETKLDQYTQKESNQLKQGDASDTILLSSVLEDVSRVSRTSSKKVGPSHTRNTTGDSNWVVESKTEYYRCLKRDGDQGSSGPPQISPLLVELIDTPPFNPDHVVPFLEKSLYMKLSPDILKNLATEPSKPVLTNPLLTASGAGEMNGYVDGYFLVYLAVPSSTPPLYNESVKKIGSTGQREPTEVDPLPQDHGDIPNATEDSIEEQPGDGTVKLLLTIKEALEEAWEEYITYTTNWKQGEEGDIFLFKGAMRKMWKLKGEALLRDLHTLEPPAKSSSPPIWLICTHVDSELALPQLIESGKKLAKKWGVGYVAVNSTAEEGNVEQALSLLIREIIERKK